jgi:Rrf2 family protein
MAVLQDIPNRYLEQLLATLRRGGLIKSIRGAKGGYVLARDPRKITLLEAWSCIEGVEAVTSKVEHNSKTLETQIIEEIWQEARQAANSVLEKYTLQDLCERRSSQRDKELMYYI